MISPPQKTKIQKKEDNEAVFIIEGLYPGYGTTIGNSLRRVLLSSMKGSAITKVSIKDVSHEFSTIPGVKEDVVAILLNLKGVRFKKFGKGAVKVELKAEGEKEVAASDFDLPSQLELINEDHHIATLTDKKASLEIEAEITEGVGYQMAEKREEDSKIGSIDLDAVYTPVSRVSFRIENMRVGKRTDFDRLILNVETDGRASPEKVFQKAVEILNEQFSALQIEVDEKGKKDKKDDKEDLDPSDIDIDEMNLSSRVATVLKDNRIKTLAGLTARSEENISTMEGIGPKSLKEIKKALSKRGLSLK